MYEKRKMRDIYCGPQKFSFKICVAIEIREWCWWHTRVIFKRRPTSVKRKLNTEAILICGCFWNRLNAPMYQAVAKSSNTWLNYWRFKKFPRPAPPLVPLFLVDNWTELDQSLQWHRTIIVALKFSHFFVHLETSTAKRRLRSKILAKLCSFWPCVELNEGMGERSKSRA